MYNLLSLNTSVKENNSELNFNLCMSEHAFAVFYPFA